jgi:hypothetical protein
VNIPLGDTILVAIIGLVSGAIGSLIAPWVNWGIEKRKLNLQRKSTLIDQWRQFIEGFDFENENFGNTTVYGAMRPFMEPVVVAKFEAQRTVFVPPVRGRGSNLFKQWASDQVSFIERKWKLI